MTSTSLRLPRFWMLFALLVLVFAACCPAAPPAASPAPVACAPTACGPEPPISPSACAPNERVSTVCERAADGACTRRVICSAPR